MVTTKFQIDLRVTLQEVERFFEISNKLKTALRQDRIRWRQRRVVEAHLEDVFADYDWANYDPKHPPGIRHYDPELCESDLAGGATPWPLVCFALQHKTALLGLKDNPKIVVGPGVLFGCGNEDVRRIAEMLFEGDDHQARMYLDRKFGSYRRYIMGSRVEKYDPPYVELKSDGNHGRLGLWSESLYPRILMIDK